MSVSKETAIRHLSYEEMDLMLRQLAEQIRSKGIKVKSIKPIDQQDYVCAAILAHFLGVPVSDTGSKFSLFSDYDVDFCLFNKIYSNEIYNSQTKVYIDTVTVNEEMKHTKVTLPWIK